jgi:hypothetical protein
LVQIETAFRNPKERQPEALSRNEYTVVDVPKDENEDSEPDTPCEASKTPSSSMAKAQEPLEPSALIQTAPSTIPAVSFPSTPTQRRDRSSTKRNRPAASGS